VPVAHRRQPERAVLLGVLAVAHADERPLQEADDEREHLLARQPGTGEIALDARADARQRFAEEEDAAVLGLVPLRAETRVVAVLLAPFASRPVACRWPSA
jgi:hypothetical protein